MSYLDHFLRISIRSRCWDAKLVIDGNWFWTFNDGSIAELEINTANALRTIELIDLQENY